jgi:fructose-1,6-bisphosphatase
MSELIKILKTQNPDLSAYPILEGVEIKKIKEFRGHDGMPLLQGEMFYNGKLIAYISEDGHGGDFNIQTLSNTNSYLTEIISKYNETTVTCKSEYFDDPLTVDFSWYLNNYLVASELYGKVSRARKKTFFFKPETNELFERNSPYSIEVEKDIIKNYPSAIVFKK